MVDTQVVLERVRLGYIQVQHRPQPVMLYSVDGKGATFSVEVNWYLSNTS